MSNGVDTTRTDEEYWKRVLDASGLGMNRGTTLSRDKDDIDIDAQAEKQKTLAIKNKGGRPYRAGFEGQRLAFTKLDAIASTRFTRTRSELSAVFQQGGFRHYGPSKLVGARGRRSSERDDLSDSGAFIQYVGGSKDIVRLEDQSLKQAGQVTPSGHGPDR